ncbi:sensor histidine kinase [Dactylosporangium sp. AC04546]|uniref:sensor histidine kinase n=1 Tax=Dactylosporangium sp. AC04546 TaxID=2862460 RepID=UPI001EDCEAD3|nr:sensor histidine kinase [Dactylosporangium sp. AC04546]WVK80344.1 sensor histidine kinase [Dactylosporangium sp. AC04546]
MRVLERVRLSRREPFVQDVLLALLLIVVSDGLTTIATTAFGTKDLALQLIFDTIGLAVVAVRRRWLWVAVWVTAVHSVVPLVSGMPLVSGGLGIIVMTYTVAAHLSLRAALGASALIWVPGTGLAAVLGRADDTPFVPETRIFLIFNAMSALVCFTVGRSVATRRAYIAALEDRARTAETSQRALTDKAVAEERRRIARELHDVVAHHVSVMGVLATGSRRMLSRDPAAADEALATIEETGRTALREMRRLLSVLRTEAEPAGELEPQPGLAGVEGLVEQIREAGLPAVLRVEGDPEPMDPGVSLTVYRIVQEALTNALKHAGAASVEVRLVFSRTDVVVEICDTGRGPQLGTAAIGHGLLGMRERVMLYGGTLRTGPRPGGGYRVHARIPLESASERQLAS